MSSLLGPENAIAVIVPDGSGTGSAIHHVFADAIRVFTDEIIGALMDGRICSDFSFALGFVAAINALSHDGVDFSEPVLTVERAQADIDDVTGKRAMVTDALAAYCERLKVGDERR